MSEHRHMEEPKPHASYYTGEEMYYCVIDGCRLDRKPDWWHGYNNGYLDGYHNGYEDGKKDRSRA